MSVSPIVPIEAQPVIERSRLGQDFPSTLKCWLREPLLHFLVLGLVVFAVYGYMHRGRGGVESSRQIALTLDDLRTMESYFESQWHRPPTPEEFNAMVEDKVREEVLYREALAMGLDKDDTIVKRRMAQKMQFLAEEDAAKALVRIAGQPEDSKLVASLADQFMFQDYYGDRAPEALAKEFGPQFV